MSVRRLLALWVGTRGVLLTLLLLSGQQSGIGDLRIYHDWARGAWCDGVVPGRDTSWEYPPGALPFVILPTGCGSGGTYAAVFLALSLVLDLAVLLILRRMPRGGAAVGTWLALVPLVGPVALERFDIAACLLVVAGLVSMPERPGRAGALLSLAATVKLWPAVLVVVAALPVTSRRAVVRAAAGVAAGLTAVLLVAGFGRHLLSSLSYQSRRGVEIESVVALPGVWSHALGGPGFVFVHGSWELRGAGTVMSWTATGALALVLLATVARGLRCPRPPVHLLSAAVVAVVLVTDKVLSPQYLLWLAAVVAVLAGLGQLPPGALGLSVVTAGLTQTVYPYAFGPLLDGDVWSALVLTLRNGCLVALAGILLRAAWRGCSPSVPRPVIPVAGQT